MIKEITDQNFAEVLATGAPLVVDFWAPWCGPCRMMHPVVDELAEQYEGKVVVGKLNVDENDETCAEYRIMSIPSIVFFKNGKEVDRVVGACPKAELQKHFDAML